MLERPAGVPVQAPGAYGLAPLVDLRRFSCRGIGRGWVSRAYRKDGAVLRTIEQIPKADAGPLGGLHRSGTTQQLLRSDDQWPPSRVLFEFRLVQPEVNNMRLPSPGSVAVS